MHPMIYTQINDDKTSLHINDMYTNPGLLWKVFEMKRRNSCKWKISSMTSTIYMIWKLFILLQIIHKMHQLIQSL